MAEKSRNAILGEHLSRRRFVALSAAAAGCVLFSLPERAHASNASEVKDSLGNSLDASRPIARVVPMGIYAQTLMETLFPEALVSLAKEVSSDAPDFQEAGLADVAKLPETGVSRGSCGKAIELERVKGLNPDLVLQVGFGLDGAEAETDRARRDTGAQAMYLDISFGKLPEAYRKLGQALGCGDRAHELAGYIEDAQSRARSMAESDSKGLRVFYGPRVAGKKVTQGVRVQVDALTSLGFEAVTAPYDFEGGTVDFEALRSENPDFILLDDTSFPAQFFSASGEVFELWKTVPAIGEGRFAVAPALMHSILGSAVFAQSIGMLWMACVLSGDAGPMDMVSEMQAFYRLFYNLDKEPSEVSALLGIGEQDA